MTTRDLIDDFIAHIADMPDTVLKYIHTNFKWAMHYNPVCDVLEFTCIGFAESHFDFRLKRNELGFIFDTNNLVVDDMSGEDWFLSWRDGPDLEITGLEELL